MSDTVSGTDRLQLLRGVDTCAGIANPSSTSRRITGIALSTNSTSGASDSAAASTSTSRSVRSPSRSASTCSAKASIETSKQRPRSSRRMLRSISSPPSLQPDRLVDPVLRRHGHHGVEQLLPPGRGEEVLGREEPQHLLAGAGDPVGGRRVREEPVVAVAAAHDDRAPRDRLHAEPVEVLGPAGDAGARTSGGCRGTAGSRPRRSRAAHAPRTGAGSRRSRCPRPTSAPAASSRPPTDGAS